MIRVCFAVDAPFLGGAEYYVSRLAAGLDRRRFSASVLLREGDGGAGLAEWAAGLESDGIAVTRVPMRLPWRVDDAPRIWRAFDRISPHVVHVNMPGPYSGQTGLLAPLARAAGARVVTTEHLPMVAPLWKRAAVKRLALRFVDVAVTMTRVNAALLVDRQGVRPDRVRVVANGVFEHFGAGTPVAREAGVVFAFVGNMIAHKGLSVTLEALSMLHSEWRLVVAGEGPDESRCRDLAARLGVSSRVTFLGRQHAGEIESLLRRVHALVLPSEMEGLPYVILEAMASSLPVVASNVYGIPEAVVDGETGLLVPPRDAPALALALERIAGDAELRARMGVRARTRFENLFTLARQVETMSALYENLVNGSREEAH